MRIPRSIPYKNYEVERDSRRLRNDEDNFEAKCEASKAMSIMIESKIKSKGPQRIGYDADSRNY